MTDTKKICGCNQFEEKVVESTVVSLVIPRNIEEVWDIIEKFHALSAWHPAVVSSELKEGYTEDVVGAVRRVTLGNGATGT